MAPNRKIPETEQPSLLSLEALLETGERTCHEASKSPAGFQDPDPARIFIGEESLRGYLVQNDLGWVVRLRTWISRSDLSGFVSAYDANGRRAIHPRILLGLIVYGMLQGQWSLRDLEKLARRDVGAWWICGGLQPDHSTIGKFINLHASVLTEPYFLSLTKMLARQLNLGPADVAGDGTVIEACGSRFKNLQAEALQEAAGKAREQARKDPQDAQARRRAEAVERATEVAREREGKAKGKGRKKNSVQVCLSEPEAVVQPLKNKARRPSYKPSVLANKQRFIVGQGLDPSSETAVVRPMLRQHEQIFSARPTGLFLDAGYNSFGILAMAVEMDLDLLCPAGKQERSGCGKRGSGKQFFSKKDFLYDPKTDSYLCPAGYGLPRRGNKHVHQGRKQYKYRCRLPADCPYRKQCTRSRLGRTIIRYEDDPLKEAMRQVLEHPKAKKKSCQRKWMVEPVFSVLRDRQGLRKFHRRGLNKVRVEFALHCTAYNLGRALRLEKHDNCLLLHLFFLCLPDRYLLLLGLSSLDDQNEKSAQRVLFVAIVIKKYH